MGINIALIVMSGRPQVELRALTVVHTPLGTLCKSNATFPCTWPGGHVQRWAQESNKLTIAMGYMTQHPPLGWIYMGWGAAYI